MAVDISSLTQLINTFKQETLDDPFHQSVKHSVTQICTVVYFLYPSVLLAKFRHEVRHEILTLNDC